MPYQLNCCSSCFCRYCSCCWCKAWNVPSKLLKNCGSKTWFAPEPITLPSASMDFSAVAQLLALHGPTGAGGRMRSTAAGFVNDATTWDGAPADPGRDPGGDYSTTRSNIPVCLCFGTSLQTVFLWFYSALGFGTIALSSLLPERFFVRFVVFVTASPSRARKWRVLIKADVCFVYMRSCILSSSWKV